MSDDLIRRQDAIDAVKRRFSMPVDNLIQEVIGALPSAQPKQTFLTNDDIETIRIHLGAIKGKLCNQRRWNEAKEYEGIIERLLSLPSAQPEPQWIPCTERMPEDYEDVLVWFEYFRYGSYNRLYQTHGIGDYSSEYNLWTINHQTGWRQLRVLAWMPLPDPPKGEQE